MGNFARGFQMTTLALIILNGCDGQMVSSAPIAKHQVAGEWEMDGFGVNHVGGEYR